MLPVLGRMNVQNDEIDAMIKEAPGPINFTVFLTMFGEKLKGKFVCICVSVCLSVFMCLHLRVRSKALGG